MIPKIIHYIWFGDQSKKPLGRIKEWKRVLRNWDIKEWNESNLDIEKYKFSLLGYNLKKYGACVDPYRPEILAKYGGLWLDTDVNVYEDLEPFLMNSLFAGFSHWICNRDDSIWTIGMGLLGVIPEHPVMNQLTEWYKEHWTKTSLDNNTTSASYERAYLNRYPHPEMVITRIIQGKYKLKPNGISQKIDTIDGAIQIESPPVFTIRGSYKTKNYAEHLFEGTWLDRPFDRVTILKNQYKMIIGHE